MCLNNQSDEITFCLIIKMFVKLCKMLLEDEELPLGLLILSRANSKG